jgi:hypothetical protein
MTPESLREKILIGLSQSPRGVTKDGFNRMFGGRGNVTATLIKTVLDSLVEEKLIRVTTIGTWHATLYVGRIDNPPCSLCDSTNNGPGRFPDPNPDFPGLICGICLMDLRVEADGIDGRGKHERCCTDCGKLVSLCACPVDRLHPEHESERARVREKNERDYAALSIAEMRYAPRDSTRRVRDLNTSTIGRHGHRRVIG